MDRLWEITRAFELVGLEAEAARFAAIAHFEIAVVRSDTPADQVHPLGASRLGGTPDFARSRANWPCHRWSLDEVRDWPDHARDAIVEARTLGQVFEEAGDVVMPLPFLLQIDLASLHEVDRRLPDRGLLLFFAAVATDVPDPLFSKRVASAVVHVDSDDLETARPRPTADSRFERAVSVRLERRLRLDLPWEDRVALTARCTTDAQLRFVEEACSRGDALFPIPANECGGPMPPPGEIALLRLHEHDDLGFFVGDASWLTFSLPETALRSAELSAARASVFIG